MKAFNKKQPRAARRPSHRPGISDIQGIANGRRRIPDSPESAGFFDATKNIQLKIKATTSRNNPATINPARDFRNVSGMAVEYILQDRAQLRIDHMWRIG